MRCTTRATFLGIAIGAVIPAALLATATAQPPGPPPGRPLPPHGDPLRRALDANGDHELDADEISKAAESLAKLDADGDGRITREELFPRPPMGGPGRGPGDQGGEGRPGPPGEFGGPPPQGGPRLPPPPRDGEGFRPPPGPDPQRFVERAMSFDADGDGKLDRDELTKFAEEAMGRIRPRDGEGFRREPPPRPGDGDRGRERPDRPGPPGDERGPEGRRRPFSEEDRPPPPPDAGREGV